MAARDKIIPTAIIFSNALKGVKGSTNPFRMSYGKTRSKYDNTYTDAIFFFASIYAKELKIAGGDATWNQQFVDGANLTALYTPNRNMHSLTLGSVVASTEAEWNELQQTISRAFNIVYPFEILGPWTKPEVDAYNALMGAIAISDTDLKGADGSVLDPGPIAPGPDYANAWNNLRVPYDASIGVETYFIAPILKPATGQDQYYRFTGKRRWFGFEGYDSL